MKVTREFRDDLVRRVQALSYGILVLMAVVAGAFWFVQGVQGDHFRSLAENNRLRKVPLRPPRGLIFDRDGKALVENIPSYNLLLDRGRMARREASLAFAADILGVGVEELEERLERARSIPPFQPVRLAERLTLAQVARFAVSSLEFPEFNVDVEHLRLYRHGTQTGHVLGYLGEAGAEDLTRRPEVYAPGDLVGKRGVEQVYDTHLRGQRGHRVVVVDSRGEVLNESGRESASPGEDLSLTLDLELQQEAERQLRDQVGAVVALDPRSGEVLALYSSPGYNPNRFALGISSREWRELVAARHKPLQNRAIQNTHPPGSVFKVVMAAAGLQEGMIQPEERVYCRGFTTIYNHRFHCGRRQGHGWVDLEEALAGSCNIYFYQLGQKLGLETIARYARTFGLGEATGIDLEGEVRGLVPSQEWSRTTRGQPWYPGETISLAVGQGPLLVTPLQVARMMAAVANGGRLVTPFLNPAAERPEARFLGLEQGLLEPIRRGLAGVVEDRDGTAYWFARVSGLPIAGKTGTAQVVRRRSRNDEEIPFQERTHAWFASFAPVDDPQLVIVVFVEHGGAGSSTAAPIAKALYEKHFQARLQQPVVRHLQSR